MNRRTIENASDFSKERSNPFCAFRNLDVEELLHREGVAELVCHWKKMKTIRFELQCKDPLIET